MSISTLRFVGALLGGACLLLTACEAVPSPPTRSPDFNGRIVRVQDDEVLVKGASGTYPVRSVDARLRRTERVNVFRRQTTGAYTAASFEELRAGQRVHAWTDGLWIDSDPLQADAEAVVILPNAKVEGDAAVWDIDTDDPPGRSSQTFTAMVTRLACSSGVTGAVLDPDIVLGPAEITVTFEVEALPPGDHTCPGNDQVPYTVNVDEPIGDRTLVDGACLPGGAAASTPLCANGGIRWRP